MKGFDWKTELLLMTGVAGVVCYRLLPDWWHLIMWFPILIGFSQYYGKKQGVKKK